MSERRADTERRTRTPTLSHRPDLTGPMTYGDRIADRVIGTKNKEPMTNGRSESRAASRNLRKEIQ